MRSIPLPENAPEGLLLFEPVLFKDARGLFFESYTRVVFSRFGVADEFVQDNESISAKNVLRGLHFQKPPFEQGKLVRVVKGSIYDVAADIRKNSPTYGRHFAVELNDKSKKIFWIPPGFAHGFISLEENTIVNYKCTKVYNRDCEGGIIFNDPDLKINWLNNEPTLSEKDLSLPSFRKFDNPF